MAFGQSRPGWGGARIGAGGKPKPKPVTTTPEDEEELRLPPSDISAEEQTFWRTYAPLALERGTLTDATVPSFRLLCELHAKKTMVGAMVDKGALGGLRVYMQLAKQVEHLMGRFCLAPFGKPTKAEVPKPNANPWSSFAQRLK